jgi:hypothetical protein
LLHAIVTVRNNRHQNDFVGKNINIGVFHFKRHPLHLISLITCRGPRIFPV